MYLAHNFHKEFQNSIVGQMKNENFFSYRISKAIGTKMLFFLPQLYLPKWNIKCRKLYDWTTYTTYTNLPKHNKI